jgi:hypothetical protein
MPDAPLAPVPRERLVRLTAVSHEPTALSRFWEFQVAAAEPCRVRCAGQAAEGEMQLASPTFASRLG